MTNAAAWQHGIALARLRELAVPFRLSNKPHVYGAFGLAKERDVASAIAEGRIRQWPAEGVPQIVAFVKRLERGSVATDFRGERIRFPAGALVIEEIGYNPIAVRGADLAAFLGSIAPGPDAFVEWFREDLLLSSAILQALGGRIEAIKIAAGSEIEAVARLVGPDAPLVCPPIAAEDRAALAMLLPAAFDRAQLEAIRAELAGGAWAQHYSSYNKGQSWTAFALRGFAPSDPLDIVKPAEMSRAWKAEHPARLLDSCDWTTAARGFPDTVTLIHEFAEAQLGAPALERVRFMRLAPGGGELTRHADITDRAAGTRDGAIMRLHIPIETSPLCAFHAWTLEGADVKWHMPSGALCYLDQRKPHRVVNRHPSASRTHLVIDAQANETLRALLRGAELPA